MARKETHVVIDEKDVLVDIDRAMNGPTIETEVIKPGESLAKLAEEEKFMADVLDVVFAQPADHNDFLSARVGVNGVYFEYPRDQSTCKVPRYVVEALARTRTQRIKTELVTAADGSRTYVPKATETVTYPFSVQYDPRGPMGVAWLQRILQERFL